MDLLISWVAGPFFDVLHEKASREKLQAVTPSSILHDQILNGLPRCREVLYDKNGSKELVRFYEEGPTGILVIGIIGDPQSARFREVVRSMTYASASAPFEVPTGVPAVTGNHTVAPVDVLSLIDPHRHQILGNWQKRGQELLSPKVAIAILELPVEAPPSYEMDLEVERIGARVESFNIGFPIDKSWGMVVLDGYRGEASGLNLVNGVKSSNNPERYRKPVFGPGKNQIKLRVTPKTVLVEVNGKTIVNWTGDPASLSIEDHWIAAQGRPFIGTWYADYIVSRILVRGL